MRGDDAELVPTIKSDTARKGLRVLVFWPSGSAAYDLKPAGVLTIGRAPDCDVRIRHDSISRLHARLHLGHTIRIEDCGSSNGTVIGGTRIAANTPTTLPIRVPISMGEAMLIVQGADAQAARTTIVSADEVANAVAATPMKRLYKLIDLVAKSSISVLLSGETGVGKEVVAELIHRRSSRSTKPLVKLNCAAFPDALLESELFGYEKGAFTGAATPKIGLFETGNGGTVFLDELGEMPLAAQAKLLRAIETREVLPIGALKPRAIDVRLVAASNRDLEELSARGLFRQDLYFRLNGISVHIPPLRERKEEIADLCATFIAAECAKADMPPLHFSDAALALLRQHSWPGNIRELRNVVERAVLLCAGDTIEPSHVMLQSGGKSAAVSPASVATPGGSSSVAEQRQRIVDALASCDGNQTVAARLLGISRRTLVYRLSEYGIVRQRKGL